jgi:hypothetical protein
VSIPYLVWSFDYDVASAGPKTLHRLCHELNLAGQRAYVGFPQTRSDWQTPFRVAPLEGDWIAVYPEVVTGNPWGAPHVVRWMLNTPGRLGGDMSYDPSEIVFVYSELFDDLRLGPERLLKLPAVELDIYTDRHLPRSGAMFYVGKGRRTQALPTGAVAITYELRKNPEALADALNRTSVLYTFDTASGMTEIARLCGCPVVYLSHGGEYAHERYVGTWAGIGWNEMPEPFDSDVIRAEQIAQYEAFKMQLARFIAITQAVPVAA